jgi:hypothetical protein
MPTVCTLTGKFVDGTGLARTGRVTFVPTVRGVSSADDLILSLGTVVRVLDASGSFSVDLYRTDDASWAPSGWVWTVLEDMTGATGVTYAIELTSETANLADLSPVVVPDPYFSYVLQSTYDARTPAEIGAATDADLTTEETARIAADAAALVAADDTYTPLTHYWLRAYGGSITSDNLIAGHPDNAVASDLGAATISGGGNTNGENIIGGDGSVTVNTDAPNVASTGTGADYSIITGGYDNVAGGLASVISGFHNYTASTGVTHGTIGGGSVNRVTAGDYGTIGGGTDNEVGATDATIAGGSGNVADGAYSFTAGQNNTVSASGAAALGSANTVTGTSSVAVGQLHTVEGNYSSAFGRGGRARTYGQRVHSSNERTATGDTQASSVVVNRSTTDATVSTLGVTGGNTVHKVLDDQTVAFTAIVVAREAATGDSAMFEVKGLMSKEVGANSSAIGTPTITQLFASAAATSWAVTASLSSSVGSMSLRCQGQASKSIEWVGRIDMVEVLT